MTRIHCCAGILSLCLVLVGCEGSIGEPSGQQSRPPGSPVNPEVTPELCQTRQVDVGASPLRRLTQLQYRNTVLDLLGSELPEAAQRRLLEIVDGRAGGFQSTTSALGAQELGGYLTLADLLAPVAYERFVDCAEEDRACAEASLSRFARLAYRRQLSAEDLDSLLSVYDALLEFGAEEALTTAFSAALASPHFLYHAEPVLEAEADGDVVPIDAFALASRLSYFLWVGPPDESLLQLAETGALSSSEGISQAIVRMLSDPKAQRQTESFYEQLLHAEAIEGLTRDDPAFTDEMRAAMAREPVDFAKSVVEAGGGFSDLLTADHTVGDEVLASLYGTSSPDAEGRIALNPEERSGILTLPGVLASQGTIYPLVHRGAWVRNVLLCDPPPPPPPGVDLDGSVDRLSTEPCAGCHVRMDPIGMGFAAFDNLGRFVESEAQGGEVLSPDGALDLAGAFSTPRELGERMAQSQDAADCFTQQWFRFGLGRANENADQCDLLGIQDAFSDSRGDLSVLSELIAESSSFRLRSTAVFQEEEL